MSLRLSQISGIVVDDEDPGCVPSRHDFCSIGMGMQSVGS